MQDTLAVEQAATLWVELDPDSADACQTIAVYW